MNTQIDRRDRARGALVGLACGDAVGTTLEFKPRGTFVPITDMVGGGPFNLKPGQWTDDTSMALCLAHSLLESGGFNPIDQLQRYLRWRDGGYMSVNGRCFDIGSTVNSALENFTNLGNANSGETSPLSAGNGSIMRLAPIPIRYQYDLSEAIHLAGENSRTTHGTLECVEACRFMAQVILAAFSATAKTDLQVNLLESEAAKISTLGNWHFLEKSERDISGSGYVVDSLEAALWCFFRTENFEAAILQAANLGDDADTTAAVCGQIAGAYYGYSAIPDHWLGRLAWRDEILHLADQLFDQGP